MLLPLAAHSTNNANQGKTNMSKYILTFAGGKLAAHQTEEDANKANEAQGGDVLINNIDELLECKAVTVDHMTTLYNAAAKAIDTDAKETKSLGKDPATAATKLFAILDSAFGTDEANTSAELDAAIKPERKKRVKKEASESSPAGPFAGKFWIVAPVEPKPRRAPKDNPARGYNSMMVIRNNPGISTEDYLAKGGRMRDLKKDVEVNGNVIEVVGDEKERAAFVKKTLEETKVAQAQLKAKAEAEAKAAEEAAKKKAAEKEAKAKEEAAKKAAAEKKAADEKAAADAAAKTEAKSA